MSRRTEFDVAARQSIAKSIKSFRVAMRSGDCGRARVYLEAIETSPGHARRSTIWQLQDQFVLACKLKR